MNRTAATGHGLKGLLGFALAGLFSSAVQAQSGQEEVERLNHEAMEAYHVMDVDRAGGMLEEALRIAQDGGVTAQAVSLTHLNLGVVYIGALGDGEAGGEQFVAGLCMNPTLELDPLTSTPQMKEAFANAQREAGAGNCPTPVPTASAPAAEGLSPSEAAAAGYDDSNAYAAATPAMDDETPWGDSVRDVDQGEMAPFFAQLSFALGGLFVAEGMEADRPAPENQVFALPQFDEQGQPRRDEFGQLILNRIEDPRVRWGEYRNAVATAPEGEVVPAPTFFLPGASDTGRNDWVPDANSEDYSGAYGGTCGADDVATGPLYALDNYDNLFPSKYCVRVQSPGLVFMPAIRANLGYFVTERFSLAAVSRFQLGAGQGLLAGILLGGRGEFLIVESGTEGLSVSAFFGATLGQIQARVSSYDYGPWTVTGPAGGHIGSNIRYRFTRNIGIVVSPQVDLLFPAFTYNVDLPVGVEFAL